MLSAHTFAAPECSYMIAVVARSKNRAPTSVIQINAPFFLIIFVTVETYNDKY